MNSTSAEAAPAPARNNSDELSLKDLLDDAWRAKWIVIAIVLVCTVGGGLFGVLREKTYEAAVTISPVSEEAGSGRMGGLGALAAQYSGLASLAGISLPGSGSKQESVAVLQSDLLTTSYIHDNDLLPTLFAKQWDAGSKTWKVTAPNKKPTLWKGNQFFKKRVRSLVDDKKTGMVVMSIRWTDPQLASKWANDLVKLTNSYLRDKALRESERNIQFLSDQASKTTLVEARKAIYSLLEDEINKSMLARGREEYALKVIDPAIPPEKPASYGGLFLAIFGFAIGAFLAVFWIFGRRILLN
jgi:uncharacterized protein involved in exopolysaccharide biosynthesis